MRGGVRDAGCGVRGAGCGVRNVGYGLKNEERGIPRPAPRAPRPEARRNDAAPQSVTYEAIRNVRNPAPTLSDMYAYPVEPQPISLGDGREAERIYGAPVSGS